VSLRARGAYGTEIQRYGHRRRGEDQVTIAKMMVATCTSDFAAIRLVIEGNDLTREAALVASGSNPDVGR
jgi:hypothetical protein